jgi:hypothetical protein
MTTWHTKSEAAEVFAYPILAGLAYRMQTDLDPTCASDLHSQDNRDWNTLDLAKISQLTGT